MVFEAGFVPLGDGDEALLAVYKKAESESIQREVILERQWWSDAVMFTLNDAIHSHILKEVPIEGHNYRLVGKLRSNEEPRLARSETIILLATIEDMWRERLTRAGLPYNTVYLSVTSLYRDEALQQRLRQETHMASLGLSAHGAGAAIDFDPRGYYFGDNRIPINYRHPLFNQQYTESLAIVLEELASKDTCHLIYEHGFKLAENQVSKYTACLHVCVNPNTRSSS